VLFVVQVLHAAKMAWMNYQKGEPMDRRIQTYQMFTWELDATHVGYVPAVEIVKVQNLVGN
jgi:hypothetical protein